jgi:hypothetical protein
MIDGMRFGTDKCIYLDTHFEYHGRERLNRIFEEWFIQILSGPVEAKCY